MSSLSRFALRHAETMAICVNLTDSISNPDSISASAKKSTYGWSKLSGQVLNRELEKIYELYLSARKLFLAECSVYLK